MGKVNYGLNPDTRFTVTGLLAGDDGLVVNLYVAGFTDAPSFPATPGAYQTAHGRAQPPGARLRVVAFASALDTGLQMGPNAVQIEQRHLEGIEQGRLAARARAGRRRARPRTPA